MSEKIDIPCPVETRLLIKDLKEPAVFRGLLQDWDILSWTLEKWADKLGSKSLPFRSGDVTMSKEPQWEGKCKTVYLTMSEFIKYTRSKESSSSWLYFDYKHMNEWFQDNPAILETVQWDNLGFPERKGSDSTLWIGSEGAHTSCHLDTYGCNLVAQVFGRKQWTLFPPESTTSLLPTRVPYEESSVYSSKNFNFPNEDMATDLRDARVFTLNPGEVLYVPHHWWHYVENIETAISVNTWIPLPSDNISRLDESLVRFFISQLCKDVPNPSIFLNPNEEDLVDCPLLQSIQLIQSSLQNCNEPSDVLVDRLPKRIKVEERGVADSKTSTMYAGSSVHSSGLEKFNEFIKLAPRCSGSDFKDMFLKKRNILLHKQNKLSQEASKKRKVSTQPLDSNVEGSQDYFIKKIINSFCHPNVISLIRNNMLACSEPDDGS